MRLYSATALNTLADSVTSVALPLAALWATGSVAMAAGLSAATHLASLLVMLPAGTIADSLPRRRLILVSYLVEAMSLGAVAVLAWSGTMTMGAMVALGAFRGLFSQLSEGASAGYATMVLGREHLLRFNSRVEVVEGGVALVGPALAGALTRLGGGVLGVLFSSLASVVNAVLFAFLPAGERATARPALVPALRRVPIETVRGMRYVSSDRLRLSVALGNFALGAMTGSYALAVVAHVSQGLGYSSVVTGFVLAASGVGGLIAALTLERFAPVNDGVAVALAGLISSATLLVGAGSVDSALLVSLLLVGLDIAWVACFIYLGTLEQYVVTDEMLARMSSVCALAFAAGAGLASLLAVWILEEHGATVYLMCVVAAAVPAVLTLTTCLHKRVEAG